MSGFSMLTLPFISGNETEGFFGDARNVYFTKRRHWDSNVLSHQRYSLRVLQWHDYHSGQILVCQFAVTKLVENLQICCRDEFLDSG